MKNKTVKILDLAEKIIKNEFPRFVGGQDLLEVCLQDLRYAAVAASINNEPILVNAIVDSADDLEKITYDWNLKESQRVFTRVPNYVPICICTGIKAAELLTPIKCEACWIEKKKVA